MEWRSFETSPSKLVVTGDAVSSEIAETSFIKSVHIIMPNSELQLVSGNVFRFCHFDALRVLLISNSAGNKNIQIDAGNSLTVQHLIFRDEITLNVGNLYLHKNSSIETTMLDKISSLLPVENYPEGKWIMPSSLSIKSHISIDMSSLNTLQFNFTGEPISVEFDPTQLSRVNLNTTKLQVIWLSETLPLLNESYSLFDFYHDPSKQKSTPSDLYRPRHLLCPIGCGSPIGILH